MISVKGKALFWFIRAPSCSHLKPETVVKDIRMQAIEGIFLEELEEVGRWMEIFACVTLSR